MKICIFFDGQNFYRSLLRYDESLRVDYDKLAAWITQQVGGGSAMFGGAYYYVGVSAGAPPLVEGFLKGLELRPGYFVKREPRVRRTGRCNVCSGEYEYTTEKRVDTRLVADLIHLRRTVPTRCGARLWMTTISCGGRAVNALGKQVWVATWLPKSCRRTSGALLRPHPPERGDSRLQGRSSAAGGPRARTGAAARHLAPAADASAAARPRGGQQPRAWRRRAPAGRGAPAARQPRVLRDALEVAPAAARRARARSARPANARGGAHREVEVTDPEGRQVVALRTRERNGNIALPG